MGNADDLAEMLGPPSEKLAADDPVLAKVERLFALVPQDPPCNAPHVGIDAFFEAMQAAADAPDLLGP